MNGQSLPLSLARARMMVLSIFIFLALAPETAGLGQGIPQTSPGYTRPQPPGTPSQEGIEPGMGPSANRLEKLREDERHKRLLADTEKLLALSTELKDEVDKTSKDELSVDVVRKAAEIEKLAHDVKERMKS